MPESIEKHKKEVAEAFIERLDAVYPGIKGAVLGSGYMAAMRILEKDKRSYLKS